MSSNDNISVLSVNFVVLLQKSLHFTNRFPALHHLVGILLPQSMVTACAPKMFSMIVYDTHSTQNRTPRCQVFQRVIFVCAILLAAAQADGRIFSGARHAVPLQRFDTARNKVFIESEPPYGAACIPKSEFRELQSIFSKSMLKSIQKTFEFTMKIEHLYSFILKVT